MHAISEIALTHNFVVGRESQAGRDSFHENESIREQEQKAANLSAAAFWIPSFAVNYFFRAFS
jgi:hypothetical protein